jgi:ABC-type ATPase involved in cell division
MDIFTDLHQKGTTIVFATQYTGLIKRYSYRVIQILNGQIMNGRNVDIQKGREVKTEVKTGE